MTKKEWESQVKVIIEAIGNKQRLLPGQNNIIFTLHNLGITNKWIIGPFEYGRSCGSCVIRTLNRLKSYYAANLLPPPMPEINPEANEPDK